MIAMLKTAALAAAMLVAASGFAAAQQQPRPPQQGAPQAGAGHRIEDFLGLWAAQPGGQAGVEIRRRQAILIARELFRPSSGGGQVRCGTEGRGRWTGKTSSFNFRGVCADGRPLPYTRCAVTAETPDRLSSRCQNGHRMVLHRVGR
jgi:hypothetical protein